MARIETRLKKIVEVSRVNELDEPVTNVDYINGLYCFNRNGLNFELTKKEFKDFIKNIPDEVVFVIDDIPIN